MTCVHPTMKPASTPDRGLRESKGATMDTVTVTDLYEAAYLILSGCTLEGVSCIPVSESLSCRLTFSGAGHEKAQDAFYAQEAVVTCTRFGWPMGR